MAKKFKVGVQLQPQHTTIEALRRAWREADELPVDSIWTWDHFFPLHGSRKGPHFEGWTLLAGMAVETGHAALGVLVTCNSYRNPDLLADMARTADHLSGGRVVLGLGAGWYEQDFREYGYEFGATRSRLQLLEESLPRIRARLQKLSPPPLGPLPILIGGGGENVTLRLVAEHADMWNVEAATFHHKNRVLGEWCRKLGRNSEEIERTVSLSPDGVGQWDWLVSAGAGHLIVTLDHPYDMRSVRRLLEMRDAASAA